MKYALLILFFFNSIKPAGGQAILYPSPASLKPSEEYRVEVNGKNAFVYASPIPAAYCGFDMNGPVKIRIKANRDIKWVDIRPRSANINPIFKDNTIEFIINKPSQLSIELNGSIRMPLFIFANPPEKIKPDPNDKNIIYYKAGEIYNAGIIELKNDQTLYIEGGAVVVGVVKANHAKHIRIMGRGIIDGTYNNRLYDSLIRQKNPAAAASDDDEIRSLEFRNCDDILVEGITLHNSTSWQVVPIHCNHVHINNLKVVSDQPSDDGVDVVRSKNVLIENSFIRTKDDCIAIKAIFNYPPAEGVDSVLVKNCVFWNALWGNGLEIGFELNADAVKNIVFRNSDIIHIESGAAISIHNAGKATVSNILYDDIRIEDARQKLFDLAIFRSRYSDDGTNDEAMRKKLYLNGAWDGVLYVPPDRKSYHATFRGKIENIVFRNIRIVDGLFPFSIFSGFDNTKKIKGVLIENLEVHGKRIIDIKKARFYIDHGDQIKLK